METQTRKYTPNKIIRRQRRDERIEKSREIGEATAVARFVKIAPRKARLVVDMIRGKSTKDAINILRFSPQKAAKMVEKVIASAVANAENNFEMDSENLFVYSVMVDQGPSIKRFTSKAMGRATPIRKRTSHIKIVVRERSVE